MRKLFDAAAALALCAALSSPSARAGIEPAAMPSSILPVPGACDGFTAFDGAIASGDATFTSAAANFTDADIGKRITVSGAGAAGVSLATTIASRNSATSVELAANASTTVSGALWGYGSDYTAQIEAALTTGARLPVGICGHAATINIGSKQKLIGEGNAAGEESRTRLVWLGAVGGDQVVIGDGVAQRSGMIFGDVEVDGLCAAGRGVVIHDIINGDFPPVSVRRHTDTAVYMNPSVTGGGVSSSNFYNWRIAQTRDCAINTKGLVFGPGDPAADSNVHGLNFYNIGIQTTNGTALECGNGDGNRLYNLAIVTTGTGLAMDLLGSNTANLGHCRHNYFDVGAQADTVMVRGTDGGTYSQPSVENELRSSDASGALTITVGTGASIFGYKNNGRPIGNWVPASANVTGLNPTGTTSTTSVMMGLGSSVSITPTRSGVVAITVSGRLRNNTGGSGAVLRVRYGTGAAPANGAAATGTNCTSNIQATSMTANADYPVAVTCVATGLTINTTYWVDVDLAAITSGTATFIGGMIAAVEQ